MGTPNFLQLRQEIEQAILDYRLKDAVHLLKMVHAQELPLALRSTFAQLARRVHLYPEALKFLQDKIYGAQDPSEQDILEYASSIRKIGMVQQCLNLLQRIPDSKDKALYQAFCYVHQWNYAQAQIYFEKFLAFSDLNEREKIVAKLNLASCLIFQNYFVEAEKLIDSIMHACKENFFQFYLNCLEVKGQIYYQQGNYDEALEVLNRAHEFAKKEEGTTTLFIDKWYLLASLNASASFEIEKIDYFKKQIRSHGHWETLRDFDYQIAKSQKNAKLLEHVYFGTPFTAFKEKMQQATNYAFSEDFLWKDHRQTAQAPKTLDPFDLHEPVFPFGLVQHRLLLTLLSDFYRPWSVARIFDTLFPDEIYDPVSSTKRVYALVKKIQDELREQNLPYDLQATIHGYRLRHQGGGSIHLYNQMIFMGESEMIRYVLEKRYHLNAFSAQDIHEKTGVPVHKAYRLLKILEDGDCIEKQSQGKKFQWKKAG